MNLRQQIVDTHIEKTKSKLKITDDSEAFLIFSHSLFIDKSIFSFEFF